MIRSLDMKVTRASDREAMAQRIEKIALALGAACKRGEYPGPREIAVDITAAQGLGVTVSFDGDSGLDREGHFCLAWHIDHEHDTRLTEAFGESQRASVNPHHRAKCTAFGEGFADLQAKLSKGLMLAKSGEAFLS